MLVISTDVLRASGDILATDCPNKLNTSTVWMFSLADKFNSLFTGLGYMLNPAALRSSTPKNSS